jgi:predicted nucleotidyltransferase
LIKYHELQEELASILGRKVDLVSKDWLNPVIRDDVVHSSLVIYASK